MDNFKLTLDEIAVLEAAARGLEKAKGRTFDEVVFDAVANRELEKLRKEISGV